MSTRSKIAARVLKEIVFLNVVAMAFFSAYLLTGGDENHLVVTACMVICILALIWGVITYYRYRNDGAA